MKTIILASALQRATSELHEIEEDIDALVADLDEGKADKAAMRALATRVVIWAGTVAKLVADE